MKAEGKGRKVEVQEDGKRKMGIGGWEAEKLGREEAVKPVG